MKPHFSLLTAYCLLLTAYLSAQTAEPYAWDASTHPPQTARLQVWRGDTVPLAPSWGASATNGWSFIAYWSTNGAAWWSKSLTGTNSVTGNPFLFTPDMDVGARKYRLFIQAYNAGGASFRANADITMLDSPGATPAVLPAPESYPALAVELLPFMLPYLPTYGAWTNEAAARASADLGLQLQIDGLAASGSWTGAVSAASSADSSLRLASADSNWWVSVASGTATLWRAAATNRWLVTASGTTVTNGVFDVVNPPTLFTNPGRWTVTGWPGSYITNHAAAVSLTMGPPWSNLYGTQLPMGGTWYRLYAGAGQGGTVTLHRVSCVTNRIGDYVSSADLSAALAAYNPTAASSALAVASNALALAQSSATLAQLAAATNAVVQRYFVSSNAWITADFSNQTVSVSLVGAGGTNTVEVGGGADAVDPSATNLLWIALVEGLASKAPAAWGANAPDGSANPDPAYMTWLNAPATCFASGCAWSAYGSYAVLTTPGTVAFETGGDGAFRIGPDATNHFGYATGGSVLVGARAGSLSVTGAGTPEGFAEISYTYSGGDFPTLWFAPSLGVGFSVLEGALWTDNLDGTATVAAPAQSAAGFFKATTTASFSSYFTSSMPARFDGGVLGGTNAAPVVYDSVITVSSGGHTYRIPAQLAD